VPQEAGAAPPNLVLILADDLGWRDAGFQGSDFYETPHMDRLAGEGMVFTDAYANAPNCTPSRASLLTGQYTPRHQIYTVGSPTRGEAKRQKLLGAPSLKTLSGNAVTLAEMLAPAGYVTAAIGKWHLGLDPTAHGFQVNVGGSEAGHPRDGYFSPYKLAHLADGPPGEYLTDRLTDEAVAFLEEHRARPFFLFLSHYAVHTPIQARPELVERYAAKTPGELHNHAKYAAMIQSFDDGVGRVLAALDELELAERTLVVLFSDNGGYERVTSAAPLRGAKGMLYEGGLRVPLVVRWPGRVAPGSRSEVAVTGADLFPTFAAVAGIASLVSNVDGESLLPLLTGAGELERTSLFWHFPAYLDGTRPGDPLRSTPCSVIRRGPHKLLEFFEDGRLELYDLAADVGETKDRAAELPELAAELRAELAAWRERVGAPVPTQLNPKYEPGGR
jgi:arylsulfatase A-like enzyme